MYDTVEAMRAAGTRFNGNDVSDAVGLCQCINRVVVDRDGRATSHADSVIVRLSRSHLTTQIVVHEMNHAATAIYGSSLQGHELAIDVLDHTNETLAHLQSDLTATLVGRLRALGYGDRVGVR
ncbi:hypothetical protein [Williamsia serinedens]|uniref:hypothetical protein n=1 Tax=Williamsia serinedens TaxID=391736 RepID=UPI0020A4761C|nr:hypothetical protein [Williamsia serinedens]